MYNFAHLVPSSIGAAATKGTVQCRRIKKRTKQQNREEPKAVPFGGEGVTSGSGGDIYGPPQLSILGPKGYTAEPECGPARKTSRPTYLARNDARPAPLGPAAARGRPLFGMEQQRHFRLLSLHRIPAFSAHLVFLDPPVSVLKKMGAHISTFGAGSGHFQRVRGKETAYFFFLLI